VRPWSSFLDGKLLVAFVEDPDGHAIGLTQRG